MLWARSHIPRPRSRDGVIRWIVAHPNLVLNRSLCKEACSNCLELGQWVGLDALESRRPSTLDICLASLGFSLVQLVESG